MKFQVKTYSCWMINTVTLLVSCSCSLFRNDESLTESESKLLGQSAIRGAAAGALVGGIVGYVVGGDDKATEMALLGVGVGALSGATIGSELASNKIRQMRAHNRELEDYIRDSSNPSSIVNLDERFSEEAMNKKLRTSKDIEKKWGNFSKEVQSNKNVSHSLKLQAQHEEKVHLGNRQKLGDLYDSKFAAFKNENRPHGDGKEKEGSRGARPALTNPIERASGA